MTESLFDLGFGDAIVGVTDYCIYPPEVANLPKVGGTKNPRLDDIFALDPDLVIANQEENTREVVDAIRSKSLDVWVTFPRSVRESLSDLRTLVSLFQDDSAKLTLDTLEKSIDWAEAASKGQKPIRYFCPIWYGQTQAGQDWWMTFNQDTYPHDLLAIMGGENVFGERERRYPLIADLGLSEPINLEGRDVRYPRVTLDEICYAAPEKILLPNEPFEFTEVHRQQFYEMLSEKLKIHLEEIVFVDGSLITWHGTRIAQALRELPGLFYQ
jgi:ABC-type hemin transport system substrate-binding protein